MQLRSFARGLVVVAASSLVACSSGTQSGFLEGGGNPAPSSTADGKDSGAADGSSSAPVMQTSPDAGTMPPKGGMDAGMITPPMKDASMPPAVDANMPSMGGFDQFQQHNLDVVNMYRATLSIAPLTLDAQLNTFAAAGSQELSQDHMPHQHFINAGNDGSLWTSGFMSNAAENQGDPNGWTVLAQDPTQNELMQIDSIQKAMFDEGPGAGEAHGHYTNMMNPVLHRLGVGLLEINGSLYLTNDFSE